MRELQAFRYGRGGSTVRKFEGVSVRDLARARGIGPARLVRAVRRALRGGRIEAIGIEVGSRLYLRPGRRARLHAAIAEAVLDGTLQV